MNAAFTNARLPITAPSVKYRIRQRNIVGKGISLVDRVSCKDIDSLTPFLTTRFSTFPSQDTRSSDFSTALPISMFR